MTYTNDEIFPIQKRAEIPNAKIDSVIKGTGNIIENSARNIIVNGDNNYVGEETGSVTILNSSGCIVSSGVIGCTIINSSGIIVSDSDLIYINNTLISNNGTNSGAYYKTDAIGYLITLDDETIDIHYSGEGTYYLPSPVGHNKKFTVKNNSTTFHNQNVWCYGFTIDNFTSGGAGKAVISYLDGIRVQSDGVSNYLII